MTRRSVLASLLGLLAAPALPKTVATFKPGDVVTFFPGGPRMAVDAPYLVPGKDGWVPCTWFDGNHQLHRQRFPPTVLIPAPDWGA